MKTFNLVRGSKLMWSVGLIILMTANVGATEPKPKTQAEEWPLSDEIETPDALLGQREHVIDSKSTGLATTPATEQIKKDHLEEVFGGDTRAKHDKPASEIPKVETVPQVRVVEQVKKGVGDYFQLDQGVKQDEQITPDPLLEGLSDDR